jgi:hypothetical protein
MGVLERAQRIVVSTAATRSAWALHSPFGPLGPTTGSDDNATAGADKIYLGYTACPKCAKAYGKNDVVLFAKLADVIA